MSRNRNSEKTAPTLELPAGKGTQNQPLAHVPGARQRTAARKDTEEQGDDVLRQSSDKARWGYSTDMATMVAEQKAIQAASEAEEEEEEEEEEE